VRARALVALALSLCLLVAACSGGAERKRPAAPATEPGGAASAKRPNIVLVLTDDQDIRSQRAIPATMRLIGHRGTIFERSFANFPVCCPSRATLITGQLAHNHGVTDNHPPRGGWQALTRRRDTLGVWLQRAGYRTAWIGKFLNGWGIEGRYRIPPGWSDWQVPVEESYLRMYGYTLDVNGRLVRYGSSPADYQTAVLARRAESYVRRAARRPAPFFMVFAPSAPHQEADYLGLRGPDPRPAPRDRGAFAGAPLPRPPSFNERDVSDKPPAARAPRLGAAARAALRRNYVGRMESLLSVDRAVRGLVAGLRRAGELRRTVIIYTSDNGYLLGEHRMTGKKPVLYEELVRVPLMVRGPGFTPGERVAAPVSNADLAPTILGLAGASAGRPLDGVSLARVAADPQAWRRRAILLEEAGALRGLRAGPYAYTSYGRGQRELYDLRSDPYELRNRAGSPGLAPVERRLAALLARLRRCRGRACVARW